MHHKEDRRCCYTYGLYNRRSPQGGRLIVYSGVDHRLPNSRVIYFFFGNDSNATINNPKEIISLIASYTVMFSPPSRVG